MSLLVCHHCSAKMYAHSKDKVRDGTIKRRFRCTNPDCRRWRSAYSRDFGATWHFEHRPAGRAPVVLVLA